jgi:hypothetical protein
MWCQYKEETWVEATKTPRGQSMFQLRSGEMRAKSVEKLNGNRTLKSAYIQAVEIPNHLVRR